MVIAAATMLGLGGTVLSATAQAVAALYGVASNLNEFLDRHIQEMQSSTNPTVATTGRVLEAAKLGFGLGYISSVTIIAVGQYLLGNTLSAASTVVSAATLTNPIAMTCAAFGAILYGWNALSDQERNDILDRLAQGLSIGVELIKSVIHFVVKSAKELLDSKALKEFKTFIAETASLFGRTLSDVTRQTVDAMADAAMAAKRHAEAALATTAKAASDTGTKIGESLTDLRRAAGDAADQTEEAARKAIQSGKQALHRFRAGNDSV